MPLIVIAVMVLAGAWGVMTAQETAAPRSRYLIILQAGKETHEGMARAVHALLYAREFHEHGHRVTLLFDGVAKWADRGCQIIVL